MKWRYLIPLALLLAGAFAYYPKLSTAQLTDPDYYFNLAMAQEGHQQGLVTVLPQFPLLGWDGKFPDKEFLYHRFLAVLYGIGGENAVRRSVPGLAAILLSLLFWSLRRRIPPAWAAAFVFGTLVLCPAFLVRLFYLRSYVLAQILTVLILAAIDRRRPVWTGVLSAVFVLSYNNWVLLGLIAAAQLAFGDRSKPLLRCFQAILVGTAVGIVVNPCFPGQMDMFFLGLSIATRKYESFGLSYGQEIQALPLSETLLKYGLLVLIPFLAIPRAWRSPAERPNLALGLLFAVMIFTNRRMSEYLGPLSVLLLPAVFQSLQNDKKRKGLAIALCILCQIPGQWNLLTLPKEKPSRTAAEAVEVLLRKVPAHQRVMNTEWSLGEIAFYQRHDLEFLDALDPTLFFLKQPELHVLRERLLRGDALPWDQLIPEKFGARWVATTSPDAAAVLMKNPRLRMVEQFNGWNYGTERPLVMDLFEIPGR